MVDQADENQAGFSGRNAKRPRLQSGRGRGRGRKRVQTSANFSPGSEQQTEINSHFKATDTMSGTTTSEPADQVEVDSSIVARYKAWRREGNPHDSVCFECHDSGDLAPCETCRRAYHETCKPHKSLYSNRDGLRCWHCDVCVDRGWHVAPPPLTPPASPTITPADDVDLVVSQSSAPPVRNTHTAYSKAGTEIQSYNSPWSNPGAGHADSPDQSGSALASASARNGGMVLGADSETNGAEQIRLSRSPRESNRGRSSRTSRYRTLSKDIDSALLVLYNELEQVPILKQKISDFEAEVSSLHQMLRMRQNELAAMRVMRDRARAAEVELNRLRIEIANKQVESDEIEVLRARNRELETELATSRREVERSATTLQEWKQKLSSMLDG